MGIEIIEVKSKSQLKDFIRYPQSLYRNNQFWIPPFFKDEWNALFPHLGPKGNEALYLLIKEDNVIKGRIAVIALPDEQDEQGLSIGRFGWIDFDENFEIAKALFTAAETWVKAKGIQVLKGPMGFSNLDKTAMLIEGFDEDPTIAEIYNYPYYPQFLEKLGFIKAIDWIGYEFEVPAEVPAKVKDLAKLIKERYKVELVEGGLKNKKPFGYQMFELINETHRNIHGFIPFDHDKAKAYIDKYFPLLDNDLVSLVIDKDEKLVGYGIALPSFTQAFRRSKGKLFPWGYWHVLKATKRNDRADLYLIGIADHMRNKGLIALIFEDIMSAFIRKGIQKVESNPELETNQEVQSMWKNYNYRQHKRRRVFQKHLS